MARTLRLSLVLAALGIGACSPTTSSMIGYASARADREARFFVVGDTLVMTVRDPPGVVLVPYPPTLDEGRVVVNAGLASAGDGGVHVHCFDVAQLSPPSDWPERLYWREPDNTLSRVAEVDRSDAAHALAAKCPAEVKASRASSRP
ncbi:hypothetical protein [Polyangium mundeleinium]|uniref:Lipoprotein n=1 Tax=Polyangium mundeleinium TaxID=2995306 RepID=A0ABT5ESY3_9BACT|nr:hypothetical protein [Polyangium mundeleinium]MDC0744931.1 hypothetical protein [Polyangium mundeleinium]